MNNLLAYTLCHLSHALDNGQQAYDYPLASDPDRVEELRGVAQPLPGLTHAPGPGQDHPGAGGQDGERRRQAPVLGDRREQAGVREAIPVAAYPPP